eukprot:110407-Pelagomonas_calceolata.AAC.1
MCSSYALTHRVMGLPATSKIHACLRGLICVARAVCPPAQLAQLGLDAECVATGLLHEALRSHNSALES